MGLLLLLTVYLVGGVTFIPLVVAWIFLYPRFIAARSPDPIQTPPDDGHDDIVQPGDDTTELRAARKLEQEQPRNWPGNGGHDVAAGYYAVCREYTPMGINAKPIERPTPVGTATVAAPSQSVYQIMYRSILPRSKSPNPLEANKNVSQRPKKAGNVFYLVLRHGHLMLFDDEEQLEVRHVISLAHHDVSIYSGGDVTPEGELFIKRNAICLSRSGEGAGLAPDGQLSKPFYLFSENCSAKEDFYFALLRNQQETFAEDRADHAAPRPLPFEVPDIVSLVQGLHSSEEQLQTRWLNALIGRLFLAVYKTTDLEAYVRSQITKKISRMKRIPFLTNINVQKIDMGKAAPLFTNPRLRDLTVDGDCVVEADVRYSGGFRIEVATSAKLDLGPRFKAREINLVLAVVVKKLEGHMLFKVKAPPSTRFWFTFETMPKLDLEIEPLVSSMQVKAALILRQFENVIKNVVRESVVQPFWDDVPFFRTEHKKWRGGIWEGDDAVTTKSVEGTLAQEGDVEAVSALEAHSAGDMTTEQLPGIEKSHSMPAIDAVRPKGLWRRMSPSKDGQKPVINNQPSSSSTSVDVLPSQSDSVQSGAPESSSLQSQTAVTTDSSNDGSGSSSPTLSTDEASFRGASGDTLTTSNDDLPPNASVRQRQHSSSIGTMESTLSVADSTQSSVSESAADSQPKGINPAASTLSLSESPRLESSSTFEGILGKSTTASSVGSIKSHAGSLTRSFFQRRDNQSSTNVSTSQNSTQPGTPTSSNAEQKHPEHRHTTLAAVTNNVAATAKRWGWTALQRGQDGGSGNKANQPGADDDGRRGSSTIDLSQPMGRGRPLPPPGTPLPPPERGPRGSVSTPRRKPITPPTAPAAGPAGDTAGNGAANAGAGLGAGAGAASGTNSQPNPLGGGGGGQGSTRRRPVPPPPLPARRRRPSGIDLDEPPSEDVMVIAAPLDSEPSSPMPEGVERGDYVGPIGPEASIAEAREQSGVVASAKEQRPERGEDSAASREVSALGSQVDEDNSPLDIVAAGQTTTEGSHGGRDRQTDDGPEGPGSSDDKQVASGATPLPSSGSYPLPEAIPSSERPTIDGELPPRAAERITTTTTSTTSQREAGRDTGS